VLPCIGRNANPPKVLDQGASVSLVPVHKSGKTACPNLFIAGDIAHPADRQTSIAMGDGMRVAQEIYRRHEKE